jgi:hypothetical protein
MTRHFIPLLESKPGACFWMATLVRCMYVLVMSSFLVEYRVFVKRANPLLQAGFRGRLLPQPGGTYTRPVPIHTKERKGQDGDTAHHNERKLTEIWSS